MIIRFYRMNASDLKEIEIAHRIEDTYPPVLLALGVPGNILSLVVLVRIRKSATSPYLIFLAGVDLFILCVSLLPNWIGGLKETDIRDHSDVVCKLHVFAVYSSLQMSSWTLVLVTSERVCSVIYPHKVRALCTKVRCFISLLLMVFSILCLNTHFFFGYHNEFRPNVNRSRCICKEDFEFFEFKVWPWIDFMVVFVVPCLFLVFGNFTIIYKLRINQQFSRDSVRQSGAIAARKNTISFLTKMAFSLNTAFFICVSPVSIFSIGQPYWWPPETLTDQGLANLVLAWTTVTMLMYMNNSINFLLYIMFGSKFRHELKRMFIPKCWKTQSVSSNVFNMSYSVTRPSINQTITVGSWSDLTETRNGILQ